MFIKQREGTDCYLVIHVIVEAIEIFSDLKKNVPICPIYKKLCFQLKCQE